MLVSVKVPPLTRRLEITLEKTQQRKSKMCESNEEGGRDAVALGLNIYIFVWPKDIEFGWHQKLSSFPALSVVWPWENSSTSLRLSFFTWTEEVITLDSDNYFMNQRACCLHRVDVLEMLVKAPWSLGFGVLSRGYRRGPMGRFFHKTSIQAFKPPVAESHTLLPFSVAMSRAHLWASQDPDLCTQGREEGCWDWSVSNSQPDTCCCN